jgi:hypothetical protein
MVVEDLEADQALQDQVSTAYHLATIIFEQTPAAEFMLNDTRRAWVKNWAPTLQLPVQIAGTPQPGTPLGP